MYLIGTSIWVEIFLGSPLGKKAKSIMEKNECFAPDITLAEVSKWCILNNFEPGQIEGLMELSCHGIISTSKKGFLRAGALWNSVNTSRKKGRLVGLIDCIIAATAEENNLVVFTKDRHFMHFDKIAVEMI